MPYIISCITYMSYNHRSASQCSTAWVHVSHSPACSVHSASALCIYMYATAQPPRALWHVLHACVKPHSRLFSGASLCTCMYI